MSYGVVFVLFSKKTMTKHLRLMNKQFDFLRMVELSVILSNWQRILSTFSSKKIKQTSFLLPLFLLLGANVGLGQTISISPDPAPSNICAEVPQSLSVTPTNVPIVWRELNNNGTFSAATNLNQTGIKYTPNQVTGSTRTDIVIATLDEGYSAKWENLTGIDTTGGNFICSISGQGQSGARSQNDLATSMPGWVEAKYTSIVSSVFGLTISLNAHSDDPGSIGYGIQVSATTNKAFVVQAGNSTPLISIDINPNDILRVERINSNTIVFKHNRIIFYTATNTTNLPLNVDVSMFESGDALDLNVSFGDPGYVFPSDMISLNVLPIPTIDIGSDIEICEDEKVTLSLSNDGALFDYWEHVDGTFNDNTLAYTHDALGSTDRVDKVIGHLDLPPNGVCPSVSDTALITIRKAPSISVPIVTNNPICEEDSVLITATSGDNADSIFWTSNLGTFNIANGITNNTNNSIRYFPNKGLTTATRTDEIYLESDSDFAVCPTAKDTIELVVHWADSIYNNFAVAEICEGDSIEMKAIRAKGAIGDNLQWSIKDGTGSFSTVATASDSNAIYKPTGVIDSVRFDTLLVTTTPTGTPTCDAFVDTVVIKIFEADEVSNSFETYAICEGDSVEMNATLSGATVEIEWTIHDGLGLFLDADNTDAIYIPANITGTDLVRFDTLFVTSIPTGACMPAVDTVVVELHRVGKLTLSQDTTICLQDVALLRSLSNVVKVDNVISWEQVINGTGTPLGQQPKDTIQYEFSDNTNFTFPVLSRIDTIVALTDSPTLTNTTASSNQTCLAGIDTVLVTVIDTAAISIPVATTTICEGVLDTVEALIESGAQGVTWKILKGSGSITIIDSVRSSYLPASINNNTTATRKDTLMAISYGLSGCQPDTAFMEVVVENGINLTAIPDRTLCNGKFVDLTTTMTGIGNFIDWEVSSTTTNGVFSSQTASNTAVTQKVRYTAATMVSRTSVRKDKIRYSATSTSGVCPIAIDSFLITINPSHLVDITDTGTAGLTVNDPDTLVVCEGETLLNINGTRGDGTTSIEWTADNGTFSVPSSTAASFTTSYTPNTGQISDVRLDTLYLKSANTVSGCTVAGDTLIVKVNKAAALSIASDTLVCEVGKVTLSALSTGFGDKVFWEILHGSGNFDNSVNKILDTTTTATNTVDYRPKVDVTGVFRIDTIVYASVDPDGICPAVEDTIFVAVYNTPTVEADNPNKQKDTLYICEGIGLPLDGSYGGGAIGATWSVQNNVGVISNIINDTIATYTPSVGVIGDTRVDTLIITSNTLTGTCNANLVKDSIFVIVQKGPVVTAVADSLTMCEGSTINIAGDFGSVATGFTWSTKVTGSGTIAMIANTSTQSTATYTPTGTITSPGRLDVIYLTSNNGNANCMEAVDSIEIFVSAKPTLELGPDVSMCGELTQVLTPQSTGVNNQLTWTSTDGNFATNPSPTGVYQPDFTVPIFSRPDGIIVTSIDSLGLCTAVKDTMLVTVYGLARIAVGETGTVCEDDTITLNAEFAGRLADFTYTVSNNDGVIGVNNNQLFYMPNENTTQSNRVDQIVIDLGDVDGVAACPSLMDTIDVTVLNTPRAILVGDTTICTGVQINLLTESFGLIDTFKSTYSTSLINYPSTPPLLTAGGLMDTIIYGTKLIDNGCPADLSQIIVSIKETGTIALNLLDTTICEANSLVLDAGLSNPNSFEYNWQVVGGKGAFDAANTATPTYTPNVGLATTARLDTIILTAVHANNICNTGVDTILVTVVPSATLENLRDTIICEGEALSLSATLNGAATFFWASNSGTFVDSTILQTVYTHAPVNGQNGVDLLTANISFANNSCNDVQKTMRVTVVGQLIVDAGKDTTVCTGTPIQLAGTLGLGIDSAEWLVVGNLGTFDDSTRLNAIYTPAQNTGTTDREDVLILNSTTSLNCSIPIDTLLVTVKPIPTVSLGEDEMHMGTPDILLTAITSETVEFGQWRANNGILTNSTVNQTVYLANEVVEGEIRIDTIIYNADFGITGCQVISDTIVLTFEAPPAIGRDADNAFCQSICIDTSGANIDRTAGSIVVLANDINPFDTCLVRTDLDLRFWYPELGVPEPLNVMDFPGLPDSILFDCDNRGMNNINVYVASDSMNVQLCPAVIRVADSFITCGERQISGRITTFKGLPVEGFQVFVENVGTVGGVVPDPVRTDANGRYTFTLDVNKRYRIVPKNNDDLVKGVTAFDNVVISRHILGLQPFDSPFQTIAADVNKSGSVTAFDIVLIRKVVLARDNEFQNNTSWRFIEADYEFTDISTAAAASFMESFLVTENMGNVTDMDFVAVKIGDVTGNVNPNDLLENVSRDKEAIVFQTANLLIAKDNIYEVPFQLLHASDVAGYQFTLDFEGLELVEVKEGMVSGDNFGLTRQNRGLLTTAWSTPQPISTEKEWFTLRFKANKSGILSEMLTLNSTVTPIEGITVDQEQVGVKLNFLQLIAGTFDLFQNNPNPFKNSTTIGFTLPENSTARLTIVDVQGKEMQVINGRYEAGYNGVTVDLSALPKGVFYYRLETAFGTKVQKMMHLE